MEVQATNDKINELEQSFLKFARETLSHMESWIRVEGLTGFNYFAHTFEGTGYQRWAAMTAEYGTLLQRHILDILALEETQQCVQKHVQVDVLLPSLQENTESDATENASQDGSYSQQTKQQVVLDLFVPLIECLKQQEDQGADIYSAVATLTDEKLLEQYRRLRDLWSDPLEHVDITFPLVNFSCDVKESQQLSPHLFLCPLTPADKTSLWNDDAKHFPFSVPPLEARALMSLSWKLSGIYSFPKNGLSNQNATKQEVLYELGDIITALRLLKKGDIGAPAIYEKSHTPVLWQGVRMVNMLQQVRQFPRTPFQYYELSEQGIPVLKELVNALHQLRKRQVTPSLYGDMTVALRRFNQSYNRELPEDQIIDLTITLESSLLAKVRDELSYRLSLRGAALLMPTGKWEPSESQALLKGMYDIRSKIVHEGQLLSDLEKNIKKLQRAEMPPREFPQQCEDIVRDVLKVYALSEATGQSMEQINDALDKSILESLRLQLCAREQETNE
jgi:Apea-like HEPN